MKKITISIFAILVFLLCAGAVPALADDSAQLQQPAARVASRAEHAITVEWDAQEAADGYNVYLYDSASDSCTLLETASANSATLSSLESGKEYSFRVSAFSLNGEEKTESPLSAVVSDTTLPEKAVIKSVKTARQKAVININKVDGTDRYFVYMSDSADGKFKKVGETEALSFTVSKLENKKKAYFFKVRACKSYKGENVFGKYSDVTKATVYKYIKTAAKSSLMSKSKWASDALAKVDKGKYVKCIKKSGRWYKVGYGKHTGYLYNRAINNKPNLKRNKVTEKNYTTYLDDIIFENGGSIKSCYNYVKKNLSYSGSTNFRKISNIEKLEANQASLTAQAIKRKRGNCLSYASLTKSLLERAGHESYFAYAHKTKYAGSVHAWCVVKTNKGYRHIDAERGFYLLTNEQLRTNAKSKDLSKIEGYYPPCE